MPCHSIYEQLRGNKKALVILLDPDKIEVGQISNLVSKINESVAKFIFVGGSTVENSVTQQLIERLKSLTTIPIIIFPGDVNQISEAADAMLFLSLISGRNPEYLISKQVKAANKLKTSKLEIIPTAYLLIESGKQTAVERVSETKPMSLNDVDKIVDTALAGQLLGMKLVYLEAGSGALNPVPNTLISRVKNAIDIPLIVGGGIRSSEQLNASFNAGADVVVIGTAFENDINFFNALKSNF
ncbi:MAG: geranylgeranylglyceryl/heptaprenylglyceryl phosphate synthase [Bacteroidetes bacterium MedPE-SWsnd-G2]|nr:MAG: geranylgeranylglyceryl/heptaprenylglyceryl phosphate synthase [Bacteroidetes bacterium MedPE-SWsnd-G2]